jgi:SM-20-related protein
VTGEVATRLAEAGFAIAPDFADAALVRALAAVGRAAWDAGAFRQAGVGSDAAVRSDRRGDSILWLPQGAVGPAEEGYLARMEQLRLAINQATFLGLFDFETHFALYPPGKGYERHVDRLHGDTRRVISTVLYLNDAWGPEDGGELRLWLDQRFVDVPPQGGTLVAFASDRFPHEVRPARRERLSLTGWFRTRGSA